MKYQVGYDLVMIQKHGLKIPITLSEKSHVIIVGGSGSGKSTCCLYMIYKMKKLNNINLTICDFKASKEFRGITDKFAEFEQCYEMIHSFYEDFLSTPEGGDGSLKILIIDEIAGLLTHFSMKDKKKADEIRNIMSSILMLGRSKCVFLWLLLQRYSATTVFPAASGAADNFHVRIGLGRLSVDGRKSLFAGEHFDEDNSIIYGQGRGIILIDGEPIKAIAVPKVSKEKLLTHLQKMNTIN